MDGCLFNVSCNARDKCISVFKVGVEVGLQGGGKRNKDVRLRSEWPAVSRLLGDLPDRAGRKVEAQCRAAGQAEAAPPGGPRWTAHLLASLGQPYCNRTKYRAGCEGRHSLEYTAGLPMELRWLLVSPPHFLQGHWRHPQNGGIGTASP